MQPIRLMQGKCHILFYKMVEKELTLFMVMIR